jgi:hypothetical protein
MRNTSARRRNVLWRHICGVMLGLVPGVHVFLGRTKEDVDGRDKPAMTAERFV